MQILTSMSNPTPHNSSANYNTNTILSTIQLSYQILCINASYYPYYSLLVFFLLLVKRLLMSHNLLLFLVHNDEQTSHWDEVMDQYPANQMNPNDQTVPSLPLHKKDLSRTTISLAIFPSSSKPTASSEHGTTNHSYGQSRSTIINSKSSSIIQPELLRPTAMKM